MENNDNERFSKIQKFVSKINAKEVPYNKSFIKLNDIEYFTNNERNKNDEFNKKRENLIGAIINNSIPDDFLKFSLRLRNLKEEIQTYIQKLCEIHNIKNINQISCEHKAGRCHHYDLSLTINDIEIKTERREVLE